MTGATQPHVARGGELRATKILAALSVLAIACLALAANAGAASTFSATANAASAGTATTPQPVVATLNTTIDNANPVPASQTATIVQTFPAEFSNQLADFGSCPESSYDDEKTAPGGPEDPTVSCPANSLVGNGSLKTVGQAGPNTLFGVSDKVVIVKDATTGGLAFWASYTVFNTRISKIIRGTVSVDGAGQTVIAWDPTSVQPSSPVVSKLVEFNTSYNVNQPTLQALEPFAARGCAAGSWTFSELVTAVGANPGPQALSATVNCTNLVLPTAGLASVKAGTVKVSAGGKGKVTVQCSSAGPCKGSFEIRPSKRKKATATKKRKIVIAKGTYSLAAGATAKLQFTLTGAGKALLQRRGGKSGAKLKLTAEDGVFSSGAITLKQG